MLSEKIMTIASNKVEADNIQNMLEQLGYSVYTFDTFSGDDIERAEKVKPDLALIDITIEGDLNGVKTANMIIELFDIPVVLLIAASGDVTLKRSSLEDLYDYLAKPFKPRDLHASIQIALYKKKMINKLYENEQWHSTILKSIDEAVVITDKNRKIKFMNASGEALTGWKMKEAHKKDLADVFDFAHESGAIFSDQPVIKVIWDGASKGVNAGIANNLILKAKDGAETVIEYSASQIRGSKGNMIGIVFIFRDITEKRQIAQLREQMYEQQLIQADKLISLGTLVSGVAHEINNPNNFIMLNTPMLQEIWDDVMPILEKHYNENDDFDIGGLKFTEMRNYVPQLFSGINEGANRIKRIVSDLKDFARQDPADMGQLIDVNFVVKSAITLVSHQIRKSTNNFMVNYDNGLPEIRGNSQRLEQVVINLVLNACQSLENKQKGLFVSTKPDLDNNLILVEIKDEGIGIPADAISRILDPFFTTKRDTGGTGLGLSVSSGIVKDHGGELHFNSLTGKGTTVTIRLPALNMK